MRQHDLSKLVIASLLWAMFFPMESSLRAQTQVLADQLGYRPSDPKLAFVRGMTGKIFEVVDVTTNKSVYHGTIKSIGKNDESTGDVVFTLDFSQLRAPGAYRIWLPEASATSPEFRIGTDVYDSAFLASLQSFYSQRCGIEVSDGSIFKHSPCHLHDAVFFNDPSKSKDVVGGWHDAGDYGKFVPTGTVSAAFLLYLYDLQPEKFVDGQTNIPEKSNKVPDLLDEVRWELWWLLKMQREDGGVYHKVSKPRWNGEYLPDEETDARYIFDVSSSSTGDFAAVTALGARLLKSWDAAFSRQLLGASLQAWRFLAAHPTAVPEGGFKNPQGVEGGEYGDQNDEDERLWAAVELYRSTGNLEYHRYFLSNYKKAGGFYLPVSWEGVQNFAYWSYLRIPQASSDREARSFVLSTLKNYMEHLLGRIEKNGYRYVLANGEYYWGSNSVALGYAFDMIQAYEVTEQSKYLYAALDQLHYMLGRNTFDMSFVTGVGSNPVSYPYHQFSIVLHAGKPVPGLVAGGANKFSSLQGKVISEFPGKCYEDNPKNYYVNEVAINYTAPFVFVSGYLSKLKRDIGMNFPSSARR